MQTASWPLPYKAFRDKYLTAIGVVALLLCSLIGRSQIFQYPNPGAYGQGMHRFVPDSVLYVPTGCGAPSGIASLNSYGFTGFGQKIRQAALYADTCGHKVYWFDWTDSSWNEFGGGGLSPSDTTGKWFSWGYRSHDSVYFCKNTTCTFIYKDSVGSGGTDSAIAALYGLKEIVSGTTRYFYVDSFAVESRQRGLKIADSLAVVFNASIALKKDKSDSAINSGSYTTRGRLQHVIDSLSGITDFTDYHSTGTTGIPLLAISISGNHTGVNIPKIRDSTVTTIAGDSGVTVATHDSISANALQTKYRTDTMRTNLYDSIASRLSQQSAAKNLFLATPTNVTGNILLRAIDVTDIPAGIPLSKTNFANDAPITYNSGTGHVGVDTNTNDNSVATRGFVKNYLNKDTTIFVTGVSGTTYTNSALIGKQIVNFAVAGVSIPLTSVSGYTYATFNSGAGAFTLTNGTLSSDDMIQVTYVTGATIFAGGGGGGGYTHSYQYYTSGSTVTVTNGVDILDINPASSVSTLTITLPATPNSNNEMTIFFGGAITGGNTTISSLSVLGNTGQTVLQITSPTVVYSGESISYQYFPTQSTWKRKF